MKKIVSALLILVLAFSVSVITPEKVSAANIKYYKTIYTGDIFRVGDVTGISFNSLYNCTIKPSANGYTYIKGTAVKGTKAGQIRVNVRDKRTKKLKAVVYVTIKNRPKYTSADLRLMSAIIYAEAGDQCLAGQEAVGIVIMNRIASREFPNTLKNVIYQSGQFGPVRNGSLSRALSLYDSGKMQSSCITAAKYALNKNKSVKYRNKTINLSSYLFFSGYVKGARLSIQDHQFK